MTNQPCYCSREAPWAALINLARHSLEIISKLPKHTVYTAQTAKGLRETLIKLEGK